MSHALEGYDGACRHIHGHSYKFFVTVCGEPCGDPMNPKYGMVMDFGELKRIVNEKVIDRFDHAFVIRHTDTNHELTDKISEHFGKVIAVSYQPTCENMLSDFASAIMAELPEDVQLYSLRLHETATSYAEWYYSDNIK